VCSFGDWFGVPAEEVAGTRLTLLLGSGKPSVHRSCRQGQITDLLLLLLLLLLVCWCRFGNWFGVPAEEVAGKWLTLLLGSDKPWTCRRCCLSAGVQVWRLVWCAC
jgi:hypothetical protein